MFCLLRVITCGTCGPQWYCPVQRDCSLSVASGSVHTAICLPHRLSNPCLRSSSRHFDSYNWHTKPRHCGVTLRPGWRELASDPSG